MLYCIDHCRRLGERVLPSPILMHRRGTAAARSAGNHPAVPPEISSAVNAALCRSLQEVKGHPHPSTSQSFAFTAGNINGVKPRATV